MMLLCCGLVYGGTAVAPQLLESASTPQYAVSLHVTNNHIWLGPPAADFPQAAEVVVRVHDAQGQPLDGVAVTFVVAPSWVGSASLTPQQMLTRDGEARAVFRADTTGVVRVTARVNAVTQKAVITVSSRQGGGSSTGGPNMYLHD
jgi:hypothetical protein